METIETLGRVEERVKNLTDKFDKLERKLSNGITDKQHEHELRLQRLESNQNNIFKWADFAFKISASVVAAYICWRLGLPI